jgi:subtilisin family serine protease
MTILAVSLAILFTVPVNARPNSHQTTPGAWTVVTFTGRITQADRSALAQAGAVALEYLPRNSYVGWIAPAAARAIATMDRVQTARALTPAEKIHPHIDTEGQLRLHVLVFGRRLDLALDRLGGVGDIVAVRGEGRTIADVFLSASAEDVMRIASNPSVRYVGPAASVPQPLDEASAQINAGNITGTSPVVGYESWLNGLGLNGSGVKVSIVDTGVDGRHPDLAGRVVGEVDYSQSPTGEPTDIGGHGTHVAGIVGGDGAGVPPVAGRIKDTGGFLYGHGVAPKVQLIDQNAIGTTTPKGVNCAGGWSPPLGWSQLTRDALARGSSIWNASWRTCEGAGAGYLESSASMDALVLDGDPAAAGAQPFTMVFAAGNAGANATTIEAPSEAKNTIVVGATNNSRAGNINQLASFSSRGPAQDGRILPTISAPGAGIVSARALTPAVSCNTPTADGFGLYASCSGTSMASPHVAGSVALITQWWRRDHQGADPSPAMSKALLVNTATDMGPALDIPNRNEGWGRVNLGQLFDPTSQRVYVDESTSLTELGQTVSLNVTPADPSKPMKVTLVWTDVPGAAGAEPALVNDLDLTVTGPSGPAYFGNVLAGGTSVSGGEPDRLNNVENVFLKNPGGTYTVEVSAFNLPGDGSPFFGDETDQKFALVISNATTSA